MTEDLVINLFSISGFVQMLSFLIVLGAGVYVLIAFIIIREVGLMNNSFSTPLAPLFKFVAYTHFLLSVIVLLISILAI